MAKNSKIEWTDHTVNLFSLVFLFVTWFAKRYSIRFKPHKYK